MLLQISLFLQCQPLPPPLWCRVILPKPWGKSYISQRVNCFRRREEKNKKSNFARLQWEKKKDTFFKEGKLEDPAWNQRPFWGGFIYWQPSKALETEKQDRDRWLNSYKSWQLCREDCISEAERDEEEQSILFCIGLEFCCCCYWGGGLWKEKKLRGYPKVNMSLSCSGCEHLEFLFISIIQQWKHVLARFWGRSMLPYIF